MFACLFMGWLEKSMLSRWSNQEKRSKPHLWHRYIDDILYVWDGEVQELEDFIEFLNKQHPSIKFTATYDTKTRSIPFLDMNIHINEQGFFETDLYKIVLYII